MNPSDHWPIMLLGLSITILFCIGMTLALKAGSKKK